MVVLGVEGGMKLLMQGNHECMLVNVQSPKVVGYGVGKTQITILGLIRPDQDCQAVRYRGYMIMTYRVK